MSLVLWLIDSAHDWMVMGSKLDSSKYYMKMVSQPCQIDCWCLVWLLNARSFVSLMLRCKSKKNCADGSQETFNRAASLTSLHKRFTNKTVTSLFNKPITWETEKFLTLCSARVWRCRRSGLIHFFRCGSKISARDTSGPRPRRCSWWGGWRPSAASTPTSLTTNTASVWSSSY